MLKNCNGSITQCACDVYARTRRKSIIFFYEHPKPKLSFSPRLYNSRIVLNKVITYHQRYKSHLNYVKIFLVNAKIYLWGNTNFNCRRVFSSGWISSRYAQILVLLYKWYWLKQKYPQTPELFHELKVHLCWLVF